MSQQSSNAFYPRHIVDGFQIPPAFPAENFRSAVNYKPRNGDIFIVTYPKCGTTWIQQIVALILRNGEPIESVKKFHVESPFLDLTGAKAAENVERTGAIKTHLPYHLAPQSDQAKYIYTARNPKDCCVSYYNHVRNIAGRGTFDQFYEIFMNGEVDFGDYFDHLLSWYAHRNEPNVLFVTYEEMKADVETAILKVASFMDDLKYAEPLRTDRQKLNNVREFSSFDHMKELFRVEEKAFQMTEEEIVSSEMPDEMKELHIKRAGKMKSGRVKAPNPSGLLRKGVTGDWKNYFSESQSKDLDQKFVEKTKGTEIFNWWKEYM